MATTNIIYKAQGSLRSDFIFWTLDKMIAIHRRLHMYRAPWGLTTKDLVEYPEGTLASEIGHFLQHEGLEPVPRVERHDAFHVLTGYATDTVQEVAMQVFLVGNGKHSLFTLSGAGSAFLLPEKWGVFLAAFKRGQQARCISNWNYKKLLNENVEELRRYIFGDQPGNAALEGRLANAAFAR
jgi:hypothetical protein